MNNWAAYEINWTAYESTPLARNWCPGLGRRQSPRPGHVAGAQQVLGAGQPAAPLNDH
jgi:hypothetical protein